MRRRSLGPIMSLCVLLVSLGGCRVTGGGSGGGDSGGGTTTTFQKPTNLQIPAPGTTVGTASQVLIGRFTNDAFPDLVVLSDSVYSYLYVNEGGSSWADPVLISTGDQYATGVAGDFFSSAKNLDDLLLYRDGTQVRFFQNSESSPGTFSATAFLQTITSGPTAGNMVLATSPGSSGLIFVSSVTNGTASFSISFSGNSFGSQVNRAEATGFTQSRAVAADFDGDGRKDVAYLPGPSVDTFTIFRNNSNTSFAAGTTLTRTTAGRSLRGGAAADLVGSSLPDLILLTNEGVELYENQTASAGAAFTFVESSRLTPSQIDTAGRSVVVADLTGDGLDDLFIARTTGSSKLFTQGSGLSFSDLTSTAFGDLLSSSAIEVYAADIDQDGTLDLLELNSNGAMSVYINNFED